MAVRLEVESEVSADGIVHVPMPDLAPGSRVKVVIEEGHPSAPPGERVFGRLKGKIHTSFPVSTIRSLGLNDRKIKRALLDTHTYLWSLSSPDRIGPTALRTMSMRSTEVFVSVASHWELAVKESRGALRFDVPLSGLFSTEMVANGYTLLAIEPAHLLRVASLPFPYEGHADPFDRMLVAQALVEDLELLSADAKLDAYGVRRAW